MNPSFSHIQMVAIDCDETLLRSDNTVSEYTKDVLHRLQDKGIRITIATGRTVSYTHLDVYKRQW